VGRPPKRDIETRWSANQPPGFIVPEALYTIEEVKARLRMGRKAWAQLRHKGLKTIRFGTRDYILGATVIGTLTKIAKEREVEHCMAFHVRKPAIIQAAGEPPKSIEESIGRVNSGTTGVSIARMKSPPGWSEPGQTPEFDEYTVVLRGTLHVKLKGQDFNVEAGQAIIVKAGEWVRYSSPSPEGAEYIAVCIPAFSPETAHRDE
jgi:mannose-6-phosphate isomerase-like protein (cupin superfamily)